MNTPSPQPVKSNPLLVALLFVAVAFVSGCSGSNESISAQPNDGNTGEAANDVMNDVVDTGDANDVNDPNDLTDTSLTNNETDTTNTNVPNDFESPTTDLEPAEPTSTRVDFMINVPAYQSDALQVRLQWGDTDVYGVWNADELWTVSSQLPVDTQNRLVVSFNDRNGEIILARFETDFTTGTNPLEIFEISADQFDTQSFDNDADGVSNLDELLAGSNPDGGDVPQPVQASLELLPAKTFHINWQGKPDAQTYRVMENPDGVSGFSDISGELDGTTRNFDHLVALYSRINAQYLVQACNDQGCSDSEPVMVTGTLDNAIGYFKASNTEVEERFGSKVVLSADGSTLVVSSSGEDSGSTGINGPQFDNSARQSGAVYVYFRGSGLWQQQAYIKASNGERGDNFGGSMSLSTDGNTLAVGASYENSGATGINSDETDNSAESSGAAYVFVRSGGVWQQQAYIKASNTGVDDRFGSAVSLSANGNTLAVGAREEASAAVGINGEQNDDSSEGAGAAYVYVRNGSVWQQEAYLKASNSGEFDFFGNAASLSADGNTLIVAASGEKSSAPGINGNQNDNLARFSGAVYAFIRSDGIWQQQAYIKASNPDEFDRFGDDVSLSADGNTLAVGAASEDSSATGINGGQVDVESPGSGAVYVFVRNDDLWRQQVYVKASNASRGHSFGLALSLSADGNTLAVGAPGENSAATGINGIQNDDSQQSTGAVYVFTQSGGLWQQQAYVKASNSERDDRFGQAVGLSADGNTLAATASEEDGAATGFNGDQNDNSADQSGAAYIY